ncbi:AAA family ATPase [Angustibacter speluncae]
MTALLVVFAGLPGSGKTTVSRAVADRLGATFLRVDTIESAVQTWLAPVGGSPVGYVAAAQVAHDQLVSGRDVVVDAVNAVDLAREGWRRLAAGTGARLRWVEVVCTDEDEHRRRVEGRTGDWPGHEPPTWEAVRNAGFEPFTDERLLVDNVGDAGAHVERVLAHLSR